MTQVLREGYADAIKTSYGYEGFPNFWERFEAKKIPDYTDENEYLLLISEIIGKEKTMYYLINGKEKELIEEIARVTSTDISEVKSIFSLMNEQFRVDKNDEEERSKTFASNIKQKLANLAISANKKMKIILLFKMPSVKIISLRVLF